MKGLSSTSMEAGKFSFKFSRQTQKNLVGSSKYAYTPSPSPSPNFGLQSESESESDEMAGYEKLCPKPKDS
jgi:hypothetical protein